MRDIILSRRDFVRGAALLSAGAALAPFATAFAEAPRTGTTMITRPIPSSGERLPVVGLGTNQFSVESAQEKAQLQEVLEALLAEGGSVVDTARAYGQAEEVIGELVERIGQRERFFIVTKTSIRGELPSPDDDVQAAFDRLRMKKIDVMLIHNLHGLDALMPALLRAKEQGRVRYVGMSTSSDEQYEAQMAAMRRYPLDFIQVDYSLGNRNAAEAMLPLAQERGMAVMVNVPFGGRRAEGNLFGHVAGKALPDWAADIDATSWGQVFLKYVVSHPAVTVAIPGTTKVRHLVDNLGAARGRLPDADMRREIERYWDALA
jgi:aryl-alcohol dehydrogenase-like predicted oxidoreductase